MSQPTSIWTEVKVRWEFLTKICASVPADPKLREAWLEARKPAVRPPQARTLTEINEEVLTTLAQPQEEELGGLLVFQRVNGACVMRAATVRAHLKECARTISSQYVGRIQGERSFATRVINGVYHHERVYYLPICREDGRVVTEPDGRYDKAVHVNGRSAIKTFEYIETPTLSFVLKILQAKGNKPSVSLEDLRILFEYGGTHGYGGERGDGEGRYVATIEPVEGRDT